MIASYNFRYGVYGQLERGKTYIIPTFPRKDPVLMKLRLLQRRKRSPKRQQIKLMKELLCFAAQADPEITDSKTGLIEGWLTKDNYPMEGVIKDVILFGDVHGKLCQKNKTIEIYLICMLPQSKSGWDLSIP